MSNILNEFPDDILEIDISCKNISGPLDFSRFTKLEKLNCGDNNITSLNNLPNSLQELYCYDNNITNYNNIKVLKIHNKL